MNSCMKQFFDTKPSYPLAYIALKTGSIKLMPIWCHRDFTGIEFKVIINLLA